MPCDRGAVGAWDFGGEVRLPEGEFEGALVVVSYPVQDEKDIDGLSMPDPKTAGRIPVAMRFSELQREHDIPAFFFSRAPFTMAANLCGIDRFLKWTIKKPALCERLMRISIEHIFNVLSCWVDTFGAESVFAWMSTPTEPNQLISPRTMEKFALPFHMEYHDRLRALGVERFGMHICGDPNLNVPLLSEAAPCPHPSVLSFGHEVDLDVAARSFPGDIIFGNIEPAVIQMGTSRQVYDLCKTAIAKGRKAPAGFR